MNTSPTPRNLSTWLFAAILGIALTLAPASASVDPDQSLNSIEAPSALALAEPDASPGISVFSSSQCAAGYFCVWTHANYGGAMQRFSNQSQYTAITLYRVGSFYNNRSTRVFIYGNSSGSPSACYGAQAKRGTTSSWQAYPAGTYLSTAASC